MSSTDQSVLSSSPAQKKPWNMLVTNTRDQSEWRNQTFQHQPSVDTGHTALQAAAGVECDACKVSCYTTEMQE